MSIKGICLEWTTVHQGSPVSQENHASIQDLNAQTFPDTREQSVIKKSPQRMCCVDLIFVYILLSREMTGEVEFPSDFGHSELRRPLLSPPTPSSMLDLSACRVDMWSSAVAPLVGRD